MLHIYTETMQPATGWTDTHSGEPMQMGFAPEKLIYTDWKNYADIHVAKNRQGALGRIGATYIGHQVRFESFDGIPPDWDAKSAVSKARGFK